MAVRRRAAGLGLTLCALACRAQTVRVATFNVAEDVSANAEVIRRIDPDILLLNEVDDLGALAYPHVFQPAVNAGVPSGFDLDHDGKTDGPGDALGFGTYPGQYGMAVVSRYPIGQTRCFAGLLWRDVPDNAIPDGWYSDAALDVLPLSSKNHCVVPIEIGSQRLHFLVSHPTPPVFDGPEDRNGRRNHDEIRLWVDLIDGAPYLGHALPEGARFVVAGDLNADPHDGDTFEDPLRPLLQRVSDPRPGSAGASEAAAQQGGRNAEHRGPPQLDTADFPDDVVGNLRVDYVLPGPGLTMKGAGVHWPKAAEWTPASDHRLVWVDLTWPR